MITYQDKQQLAQFVYGKLPGIPEDTKTWTMIDELSIGDKEPSSGYYGAVILPFLEQFKSIDYLRLK